MTTKKVSYKNLLKQAISEYDTSKTVQVKGPMLDPILSWDGDGEIPIYKDAASILERYYFNESQEDPIMVSDFDEDLAEMEYNEDGTEAKTSSEKHGEGPGTQQAGTSSASNIKGDLKNQEEDIAKEDVKLDIENEEVVAEDDALANDLELFFSEQEEEEAPEEEEPLDVDAKMGEKEGEEKAEKGDEKDEKKDEKKDDDMEVEEGLNISEDAENSVIEKLIDEMEELDEVETTYTGEGPKTPLKKTMTYDKEGPAPGMESADEKKASGPEEDTKGAGTDQAGTGPAEGQIPPRKDQHDQMVKSKSYTSEDVGLFDDDELLEALASD